MRPLCELSTFSLFVPFRVRVESRPLAFPSALRATSDKGGK